MSSSSGESTPSQSSTSPTSTTTTTAASTGSSAPPPSDTTAAPSTTPPSTTNPPPSSPASTGQPTSPAQSPSTTGESTTAQPSSTSQTTAPPQDTTAASSTTSTLTAPQTTVVQTTVVETSNGQAFTTVFETQSVIPSGATVTTGSNPSSGNNNQSSSSNTGAIVGGVVGGVAGLLALLLIAWGIMRWRRNRYNDIFDGNFDPDRLTKRPEGGTLPNIPVDDDHPNQMAQLDDDGMGGRLNASTVGGGIVAPYPLYDSPSHPTHSASPTSPSFPVAAPYAHPGGPNASYPNNLNQMNQYWGGAGGPGRHPSPGPSLAATHTTGESPHSYHNLGPGAAAAAGAGLGVAGGLAAGSHSHGGPPSISSSSSGRNNGVMGVAGGGMTPGRLAKEREAYGMYNNQGPQGSQQPQFGAFGPGPTTSGPSAWGAAANGQRRFSNTNSDGYTSVTSGSQYSQSGPGTFAGGPGSGGSNNGSGGGGPGSGAYGGGMVVNNPDEDEAHAQGYAGGWSEEARRMYLAGGPGQPSKGSPPPPNRSGVLVHQDGGRVPQQQPQEPEAPEEIPPTYDSLVLDGHEVRGGASGPASGPGSGAPSGNASPSGGRAASPARH